MTTTAVRPRGRALAVVMTALLVGVLTGCGVSHTGSAIDYVDFVQVGDHQYLRAEPLVVVPASDLGEPVGTVKRELSTEDVSPDHHPQNGESGYLPPGTPLDAVRGYSPDERIAAKTADGWVAYDVYPPGRTPSPTA